MELKTLTAFVLSSVLYGGLGCGDDASADSGTGAGATDSVAATDETGVTGDAGATDETAATDDAGTDDPGTDDPGTTDTGGDDDTGSDSDADTSTSGDGPNPEGWPTEIPAPWDGWDSMPDDSELIPIPKGSSDVELSCAGSPGNMVGLTANAPIVGTSDDVVTINASYCVIHDVSFEGYTVRVIGDHYVIRDSEIDGAGRTGKNGLSLGGSDGVAYRNTSHHLLGNDRHCYTNAAGATDTWFIENEGYYCTGDGYQAGHQLEDNRPTNIYLVRNHMHETRENGLDYKFVRNVWAVENILHGFLAAAGDEPWCFPDAPTQCSTSNSGSDGSAVVVGSDGAPIDSYHLRNVIYDAETAIRVESAFGEIHIIGNELSDIGNRCLALDKDGMDIQFTDNVCRNAGRGVYQNWRVNFSLNLSDNTFEDIPGAAIEYESGEVIDASTLTNNVFNNTGPVVYNNTSASTAAEINALPQASENTVSP